jgi:hypothetical protein
MSLKQELREIARDEEDLGDLIREHRDKLIRKR